LADHPPGGEARREIEITTARLSGGRVRLTLSAPENAPAGLVEVQLMGVLQDH